MNIKKIEKQLKKINQLFDTIKEEEIISTIERDLMLSYVRGLYEKILTPQDNPSVNISTQKKDKSTDSQEVQKPKEIIPKTNHLADVVMQEVVEADQQNIKTIIQTSPNDISPDLQKEVVDEVVEVLKPRAPEELLDLFKFDSVNELSDKLSRAPIADLTKCMGINEKIFTVQELFGGDSSLFTNTMDSMNKFSSLEQARDYLVEHVAVEQNWNTKEKIKKASNFIKLISRRY